MHLSPSSVGSGVIVPLLSPVNKLEVTIQTIYSTNNIVWVIFFYTHYINMIHIQSSYLLAFRKLSLSLFQLVSTLYAAQFPKR